MGSTLGDYMNEQQLERITLMIKENFQNATGHVLTEDEEDYLFKITPIIFYDYTVTRDDDIMVANEEEKKKLDELLETMVKKISGLIVNHVHARLESYVLYKRIKLLEGLIDE